MCDPEFGEEGSRPQKDARRSQGLIYLGFALAAFLGSSLLGFPGCSRTPYTCAACRMDRVDQGCLGLRWSYQEESECSRWYAGNVERTHQHVWVEGAHCRRFGIPGVFGGYACSIGTPITGLSKTVQVEIYQHFKDKIEAKHFFIRLGQRGHENYRAWGVLMKWVGEGYPGTWQDWWDKHRDDAES